MPRAALLLAGVLWCGPVFAQQQRFPGAPQPLGTDRDRRRDDQELARMERENEKKLNKQRQEELKKDTKKLVELANELQTYVDKTNENVLSLDVLKKAEQIEKLAHDVKSKMKAQ